MTDRPIVPSETRKRRNEARDEVASEVDKLVEAFMKTLDNLAERHGWCVSLLPFGVVSSLSPPFFTVSLLMYMILLALLVRRRQKRGIRRLGQHSVA